MRIILLIFCLMSCSSWAQLMEQNKEKDLQYVQDLASPFKKTKDKIERAIYSNHFKSIEHRISRGYHNGIFIQDAASIDFLNQSFQAIFKANSILKNQSFKFFLERNNVPNAYSTGSYLYFIHTGLFNYMDNEQQLMAVLCHEIAHDYLRHTEESIVQYAEFEKDFKREFKSLKRKELLKLIKSQDEILKQKYDLADQSRKKEIAADSLGFIFFKNLNYHPEEYYMALKNMERFDVDEAQKIQDSMYIHLFDLPGQAFQEKWLRIEKDDFFSGLSFTEHVDEDSIQSHPNLIDRVNWLHTKFQLQPQEKSRTASPLFLELKQKTEADFYPTFYAKKQYGVALYYLICQVQSNENTKDAAANLGLIFKQLYESRLNYTFNKYVPQVEQNSTDKAWQTFTAFLWNLNNEELKYIGEHYQQLSENNLVL